MLDPNSLSAFVDRADEATKSQSRILCALLKRAGGKVILDLSELEDFYENVDQHTIILSIDPFGRKVSIELEIKDGNNV